MSQSSSAAGAGGVSPSGSSDLSKKNSNSSSSSAAGTGSTGDDAIDPTQLPVQTKVQLVLGTGPTASVHQNHTRRNPTLTFRLASDILVRHTSSVPEIELYAIYETGVQAALDLGHDNLASEWILVLMKRFGKNAPRVQRLRGLFDEARGNTDAALKTYQAVREEHPLEAWPIKRMVAIYKSQGKIGDAIATLETRNLFQDKVEEKAFPFRQLHPLDDGALRELCNLHWQADNAERALFYAEELMLLDPHNFLFMSRLGELAYAARHYDRAITAYSQSVRLNPQANNSRAVIGLWQSALEWRRQYSLKHSGSGGGGNRGASRRTADIDDDGEDDDVSAAALAEQAVASSTSTSTAPSMTMAMASQLIQIAEARLKQHYQNSPLISVMELTLRRFGSSR